MMMNVEIPPGLVLKDPVVVGAVVRLTVARVKPTDRNASIVAGLSDHMWARLGPEVAKEMEK